MSLAVRALGAVVAMAAIVNAAVEPMFHSPEAPCTAGKTTICVSQFAPEGTILTALNYQQLKQYLPATAYYQPTSTALSLSTKVVLVTMPANYKNILVYKDCEQLDICSAWWNSASTPSTPIAYTKVAIENNVPAAFSGWNRGVTIPGYGNHAAWLGGQYMWRAGPCREFRLSISATCTFRVPPTASPTSAPTTASPTTPTSAPSKQPTTASPTTSAPTTSAPVTPAPTTPAPTTPAPTTPAPVTPAPTTSQPTTPTC
jgi:hypothetical protein